MLLPSELPKLECPVAIDTESSGLYTDSGARAAVVSAAWRDNAGAIQAHAWPFDQGVRDKLNGIAFQLSFDDATDDPNLPESEWVALMAWLQCQRLVFHHSKHDLAILRAGTRHWSGVELEDRVVFDTMVAASVLDPQLIRALKPLAQIKKLTGGRERDMEDALKAYLKKSKLPKRYPDDVRYDLVPWPEIEDYAAADAEMTIRLYWHQQEQIEAGEGSLEHILRKLEVTRVLYRMERRGIGYDMQRSLDAAAVLEQRAAQYRFPFKATRDGAVAFFFKGGARYPDKMTKGGKSQLDEEVLKRLAAKDVKWAAEYHECTRINKAISMWYRGYAVADDGPDPAAGDGRLHTSFNQLQVRTGRMAVSRVQLQAIPKEDKALEGVPSVRSLIQPRDGYQLWNLDLGQAELRVAAKYAKCEPMLALLRDGADLHGITTQRVFGIEPGHPDWKVKRDLGKRLSFASIFGIGPATYQAQMSKITGVKLELAECERAVHGWRNLYPQFNRAYYRAQKVADARGWVWTLPNTPWRTPSWFGPRDFTHTAFSRIVQSSLAEFNQMWLVAAEQWLAELGEPEALVLSVHDSVVLELKMQSAAEVAQTIAERTSCYANQVFAFDRVGITMPVDTKLGVL